MTFETLLTIEPEGVTHLSWRMPIKDAMECLLTLVPVKDVMGCLFMTVLDDSRTVFSNRTGYHWEPQEYI